MNHDIPEPQVGAAFESLHPAAIHGLRMAACLIAGLAMPLACLALMLVLRLAGLAPAWPLGAVLLAASALLGLPLGWRHAAVRWQRIRFRLDASGIDIHRGVWWRSEIRVPRSRVQHTDIQRGPLDRLWGLADLIVYTAGSESAAVRLGGLPEARAIALRDALLQGHDEQL